MDPCGVATLYAVPPCYPQLFTYLQKYCNFYQECRQKRSCGSGESGSQEIDLKVIATDGKPCFYGMTLYNQTTKQEFKTENKEVCGWNKLWYSVIQWSLGTIVISDWSFRTQV